MKPWITPYPRRAEPAPYIRRCPHCGNLHNWRIIRGLLRGEVVDAICGNCGRSASGKIPPWKRP